VLLGIYIGMSLILSRESLAFLAGLDAIGTGLFQGALAMKLRDNAANAGLLAFACIVSLSVSFLFFTHVHQAARTTTQTLSGFEVVIAIIWITLSLRLRR
jgi:uncharacterized membrane protein HdeD (DUF308 family)